MGYEQLGNPTSEAETRTVNLIFDLYDAGKSVREIADELIESGVEQKGRPGRRDDWHPVMIYQILRARDYTGNATWNFNDGREMSIEIPQIIAVEQFERVQKRLTDNKRLSPRNAGGVYLLQGLAIQPLITSKGPHLIGTSGAIWWIMVSSTLSRSTPKF